MKDIAENEYYSITVDEKKNRIYLTILGFWRDPDVVPNYVSDITKAGQSVSKDFTILTDITQMKPPPKNVGEIHMKAQKVLVDAGLDKTAELLPAHAIAQMAVDRYSRESGMKKGSFSSREEAEKWLDED